MACAGRATRKSERNDFSWRGKSQLANRGPVDGQATFYWWLTAANECRGVCPPFSLTPAAPAQSIGQSNLCCPSIVDGSPLGESSDHFIQKPAYETPAAMRDSHLHVKDEGVRQNRQVTAISFHAAFLLLPKWLPIRQHRNRQ